MNNQSFLLYICLVFWILSIPLIYIKNVKKYKLHLILLNLGILVLAFILVSNWVEMGRAPFKTLGESRLWYAFFLMIIGMIINQKIKKNWFIVFAIIMSSVFILVNLFNPEIGNQVLPPALQSLWFIPHVVVYILSYSIFGVITIFAFKGVLSTDKLEQSSRLNQIDAYLYIAFFLLTLGLCFGAFWAQIAWGDYWAWDPKEIWALVSWIIYLVYIHMRRSNDFKNRTLLIYLNIAFLAILICWFGIKYIPSNNLSIHTYGQ